MTQDTLVSGKTRPGAPQQGEVLAERYEVQQGLDDDALTARYRAFDQEAETSVLLTVAATGLFPDDAARDAVVDKLRAVVGAGGRYLPGLLDADREGKHVFVIEPWPSGASLREVMESRSARKKTFRPEEMLPVVAQISSALSAMPPPWRHGDVRAERVWIDPDGLRLTGPFLVAALRPDLVASAAKGDEALRKTVAPEVLRGAVNDAADRYGVALFVYEALTGELPPPGAAPSRRDLGSIGEALKELLAPEPNKRPSTLQRLVVALAEVATLPLPEIDPAPFRRARRVVGAASQPPEIRALETEIDPSPAAASAGDEDDDDEHTMPGGNAAVVQAALAGEATKKTGPSSKPPEEIATSPDAGYPREEIATDPHASTDPGTHDVVATSKAIAAPDAAKPAPPGARAAHATPGAYPATDLPTTPSDSDEFVTQRVRTDEVAAVLSAPSGRKAAERLNVRVVPGASPEGTQEIVVDDEQTPHRRHPMEGLDPRLVRAALASGPAMHDTIDEDPEDEGTNPRAPAPRIIKEGTQQLSDKDIELVEARGRSRPAATRGVAQPQRAPSRPKAPRRVQSSAPPEEIEIPAGVKPIPRARPRSFNDIPATNERDVLYDDSKATARAPSSVPLPVLPPFQAPNSTSIPTEIGVPVGAASAPAARSTPALARPSRPSSPATASAAASMPELVAPLPTDDGETMIAPPGPSSSAGRWIILGALLIAAFIILGGWFYAAHQRSQIERERLDRILQTRYKTLQQGARRP